VDESSDGAGERQVLIPIEMDSINFAGTCNRVGI
jgi:hypothetical protein